MVRRLLFLSAISALLTMAVPAQVAPTPLPTPPPAAVVPVPSTPGLAALEKGNFQEALTVFEATLQATPQDRAALWGKVQALQGLHRTVEARNLAIQTLTAHLGWAEFRFELGRCNWDLGLAQQALQAWQPLLQDPKWADAAYTGSVDALLALGRETEAHALLAEGAAKLASPSPAFLRRSLELSPGRDESLKILDALAQADPAARGEIEALRQLYGTAPGLLTAESLSGPLPVSLTIKEKSEQVNLSSLTMSDAPSGGSASGVDHKATATPINAQGNPDVEDITNQKGARVVVAVGMGDLKKEWMALDSGANVVLLSPATVKALDLKPVATAEYVGLGNRGARPSKWVIVPQIQVGPLTFTNVPAMVIERSADYWRTTAGILPMRMFRHYGMLYDRRGGKLTLFPPGTTPEVAFGSAPTIVPRSVWVGGKPYLEVRVKETSNLFFMLGTRSDVTLLDASRADAMGIHPNAGRYTAQTVTGMSGGFLTGLAENVDIVVGTTLFKMGKIHVTDLGKGYGIDVTGILGRDNLDRYQVYLDYQKNVMAFKRYDQ